MSLAMNTTDRLKNKFYLFGQSTTYNFELLDQHTINHPVKYFYYNYEAQIIFLSDPSYANKIFTYHVIENQTENSISMGLQLGQILDFGTEILVGVEQYEHQRRDFSFAKWKRWFSAITTDGESLNYKSFRIHRFGGKLHYEYTGSIPFPKDKITPDDILFEPLFFQNVITVTFKYGTRAKTLILDKTSNFCYKEFHSGKGCTKCNLEEKYSRKYKCYECDDGY